ncbi:MAG: ABC transporter permease [Defluviitaleaceae bacterium]|nr:ABC transporter permease [Defluviitaleaceae bacterium]
MLNPVLRRELITALRSWRTYMAVCVYVLSLLAVSSFMLFTEIRLDFLGGFNPRSAITVFNYISGLQLGLILLLVPAITAGQINGERERQTLDLMLVTKMSTLTIVIGKLLSSLMLVLLIIIASVPVFGAFVYFGVVSPINLAAQTVFMLVTAMMAGSVSILCSSIFKRTMVAYVISYFIILAMTLGTAVSIGSVFHVLSTTHFNSMQLGGIFVQFMVPTHWREVFTWMLAFNPIAGHMSLQDAQSGTATLESLMSLFLFRFHEVSLTTTTPLWIINIWVNAAISCVFIALSAWLVKPVRLGNR